MYTKEYKVIWEEGEELNGELLINNKEQVFDDLNTAEELFEVLKAKEYKPIIIESVERVVYEEDNGRDNSFTEVVSEEVIKQ